MSVTTRSDETGYKVQVQLAKRFKTDVVHETLRAATDQALYLARNHKHVYRVRLGRTTLFTAHPDGSWTGQRDHEPEAPLG